MHIESPSPLPAKWFLVLGVIFLAWFSILLGNRPFATPDEGRYVEIPREMVVDHEYITPRLNGVKYFEKPPLFYWLQAASIRLFGLDETAMRLWTVVFATIGCLAAVAFSWRFLNPLTGLFSGIILATSPLYYALSRLIILDMAVSVLVTLALFSFFITTQTPPGRQRRLWAYAFYTSCALGVLTKGIMTLAIVGPVILLWATIGRCWKFLWPAYLPSGLALFFLIAAPWHILASLNNPEFAYKYFYVEHFLRYTTAMHLRYKPFWFFIPVVFIGFFPWITLVFSHFRQGQKTQQQQSLVLFLWIWIAFVFVFFSIGNSKLIPYILPIFPPLAILASFSWVQEWIHGPQKKPLVIMGISAATIALGGVGALYFIPTLIDDKVALLPYIYMLIFIFAAGATVALYGAYSPNKRLGILAFPAMAIAIVLTLIPAAPEMQRLSLKPLALLIQQMKKTDDLVVSYAAYHQDLPVYLQQRVTIVEAKGELEFGTQVEDTSAWMISFDQFDQLWHGDKKLLVITRKTDWPHWVLKHPNTPYYQLAEDKKHLLLTNKP